MDKYDTPRLFRLDDATGRVDVLITNGDGGPNILHVARIGGTVCHAEDFPGARILGGICHASALLIALFLGDVPCADCARILAEQRAQRESEHRPLAGVLLPLAPPFIGDARSPVQRVDRNADGSRTVVLNREYIRTPAAPAVMLVDSNRVTLSLSSQLAGDLACALVSPTRPPTPYAHGPHISETEKSA